jgi:cysteine desulfurase / selenocysteine lyase
MLCAEKGAKLRVAPVDDSGQVLLDEYEKLLGPKTRLVAITHVSNALGTVLPVTEMVEAAHRHGARVLVDGAQAVAHMRVDVQAIGCDFYVFSGHKIFAPTGIGVVYGKSEVWSSRHFFVPATKRETGMKGALNGAEEEVYAGTDREPATAS